MNRKYDIDDRFPSILSEKAMFHVIVFDIFLIHLSVCICTCVSLEWDSMYFANTSPPGNKISGNEN